MLKQGITSSRKLLKLMACWFIFMSLVLILVATNGTASGCGAQGVGGGSTGGVVGPVGGGQGGTGGGGIVAGGGSSTGGMGGVAGGGTFGPPSPYSPCIGGLCYTYSKASGSSPALWFCLMSLLFYFGFLLLLNLQM